MTKNNDDFNQEKQIVEFLALKNQNSNMIENNYFEQILKYQSNKITVKKYII